MMSRPSPHRTRWTFWLAVGLCLVLFAQLATSAVVKSATFDEPLHTARAYYVTATGRWDMQAGHLPLLYRLLGPMFWTLPDLPSGQQLPRSSDSVEMAHGIIRAFDQPYDTLMFPLRALVMGLTLLVGATLYRWAGERHGRAGSVLALSVYAFSPNILAHGRLVTTDLLLTGCLFLAVYTFDRLLERPNTGRCAIAGLFLGLALGSKASALILGPVFVLLAVVKSASRSTGGALGPEDEAPWLPRLLSYALWSSWMTLIAVGVLWLLYGLDTGPVIEGLPPLPLVSYFETLFEVGGHVGDRGHPAFLMGRRSGHGWREYFLVALAIKTPLPTLIAAVAGSAWLLLRRRWWAWITAFLPIVALMAAAIVSSLNIGYRHILPVVPFLILLISSLGELPMRGFFTPVAGGALALWLVVGTLRVYPDYLAYFNELVGGPEGGHRYLTDSNLDWGQDLIQLRHYMEEHDIEELSLSYFGNVDPGAYGIRYEPLPSHFSIGQMGDFTPLAPAPGYYAISVTNLSGQYLIENPSVLNWFVHQQPVATIGHSINVYRVLPDPSVPTWAGICHGPGAPLDEEELAAMVGRDDLRVFHFDCRSSWAFPDNGASGWYVVPATSETDEIAPPIGSLTTIYQQENYDGKLLFTAYQWHGLEDLDAHLRVVRFIPELPARFGDVLELWGYEMELMDEGDAGSSLLVSAYWRVLAQPEEPLSLMAHLVDREGQVVTVGDALGVPIETWGADDILVQEHRLALDSNATLEGYRVELGAYWLPAVERLPIFDRTGTPVGDRAIRLPVIELEDVQ